MIIIVIMITIDEIVDELLAFEIKWDYEEFKKYYKDEKNFKKTHKKIIKYNPIQLYRYVTMGFDIIIKYEDLNNSYNKQRLHETTELLIKIGIFLRQGIKK